MKVFSKQGAWPTKVNFVDERNVMLGYDLAQDCCEDADWFISDRVESEVCERADDNPDLEGFVFDREFFRLIESEGEFEGGAMVVFRITNGEKEKHIHLYNVHNGYYGHGFEFKIDGETKYEGVI